jgi:glycosyl transferase, family 25
MHALDYFEQIYVINLPHRHDRRKEMAEQLEKIGLSFDSPGMRLFEAIRPDSPDGFPSIGTRGCFLSHLGVLQDARKHNYSRILIFEDDLNFAPDFNERAGAVMAALQREDWSLFYGGFALKSSPVIQEGEVLLQATPGEFIQTAHFLAFRGSAIAEITNFLETVLSRSPGDPRGGPMHVDGAYCWFRFEHPSAITLMAVPELGYQRSSRTDIHSLRWFDQIPGIREAIGWLRRRKNKAKGQALEISGTKV